VGEFSAEWLALREPVDAEVRSTSLTTAIAERLAARAGEHRIVDLATGTGANVRYLVERLPSPQHWRLVDRDPHLLAAVLPRVAAWATSRGAVLSGGPSGLRIQLPAVVCHVELRRVDLARLGRAPSNGTHDEAIFEGCALVTGSALLDLVSARWIDALAARCQAASAAVLLTLSYDGRWSCAPADDQDLAVHALVNRHQHTVKGFGKALGPDAVAHAVRAFEKVGYEVHTAPSDWVLDARREALQRALVEGWAEAAACIEPARAAAIEAWRTRRLAHVAAGDCSVVVGHIDLAAWPW